MSKLYVNGAVAAAGGCCIGLHSIVLLHVVGAKGGRRRHQRSVAAISSRDRRAPGPSHIINVFYSGLLRFVSI